jgi:hypothetical protein
MKFGKQRAYRKPAAHRDIEEPPRSAMSAMRSPVNEEIAFQVLRRIV